MRSGESRELRKLRLIEKLRSQARAALDIGDMDRADNLLFRAFRVARDGHQRSRDGSLRE